MIKCPFCQFDNEDGALFCEQCKSDLGLAEPVPARHNSEPLTVSDAPPSTVRIGEGLAEAAAGVPMAEAVPVAEVAAATAAMETLNVPYAESAPVPFAAPLTADVEEETLSAPEPQPISASETMAAPPPSPSPAAAPPSDDGGKLAEGTKPKLVVIRGQRINAEYPLYEGENYIGRADDKPVDVDLEDQEPPDRIWSSRQHALITYEEGMLAIEDLNSTNGTFVNRTRVHPGNKRPLHVNDVIQIGTVQMKVKVSL